ncbi:hypothetical protein DRV85_18365 [Rhodosalinus halophilus]|uniref:O-antigen ligase like membrane protein n=1 Tax=Rhodosalinus halophilus TaxID=2259333 RepID=A0A365U3U8_9RHOB|nr:hypothetical protein [Rhodosalinus halophilus]RBI82689.1 hypothetical protein DRV85_18365 [Rhodosalinus halophilus]
MPNPLAQLMLVLWPVVTILLFRKLQPDRALIWSMLAAYLILPPPPAGFDFPLIPPMTKSSIPAMAAIIAVVALVERERSLLPESPLGRLLIAVFVLSPFATSFTNGELVIWGDTVLPGLDMKDAVSMSVRQFFHLVPFLLARWLLVGSESHRALLVALVAGTLVYTAPMLIELRMSPQMNIWIYGYFQHSFDQMVRYGGYRPIVFLQHALWAAFLTMSAAVAAVGLVKYEPRRSLRALWLLSSIWLLVMLVLSKSYAPLLYGLLIVPMVLLMSTRMQLTVAAVVALLAVSYPMLKGAQMIPTETILAAAERIGPDRANSLEFRFDNEAVLQERAQEKPLFGWGSWGRNHVFDDSGRQLTISDGRWIITLGVYGWVGFLAEFWLIALPILMIWREAFRTGAPVSPYAGPLALLLAINLVDMIPNATLTPLTWLIAGTLWGMAEVPQASQRPGFAPVDRVWRSVM